MIATVETQIRVCRIEDREEANRLLYQESVIHADGVPDFFIPLEENFTEKTWEDTLNAADQVVLCAQREPGVLCGICHLIFYEASGWVHMKNAHVMNIVVDEVCRGQGIGSMLLDEAERVAKEWGAVQLNLWCWEFNSGARRLYESRGMHPQRSVLIKDL